MVKYCLSCIYMTEEKRFQQKIKQYVWLELVLLLFFSILVSTFVSKLLCLRGDFQITTFGLSDSESGLHPIVSLILSLQMKQLERWKDIPAPLEWFENTSLGGAGEGLLENKIIGKITELKKVLDKSPPMGGRVGCLLAVPPTHCAHEGKETQQGEMTCLMPVIF